MTVTRSGSKNRRSTTYSGRRPGSSTRTMSPGVGRAINSIEPTPRVVLQHHVEHDHLHQAKRSSVGARHRGSFSVLKSTTHAREFSRASVEEIQQGVDEAADEGHVSLLDLELL